MHCDRIWSKNQQRFHVRADSSVRLFCRRKRKPVNWWDRASPRKLSYYLAQYRLLQESHTDDMAVTLLVLILIKCVSVGFGDNEPVLYKDEKVSYSVSRKQTVASLYTPGTTVTDMALNFSLSLSNKFLTNPGARSYNLVKALYADDTLSNTCVVGAGYGPSHLVKEIAYDQNYIHDNRTCLQDICVPSLRKNKTHAKVNNWRDTNPSLLHSNNSTALLPDVQSSDNISPASPKVRDKPETNCNCDNTRTGGVSIGGRQISSDNTRDQLASAGRFTASGDRTQAKFEVNRSSIEACRDPTFLNYTFVTGLFDLQRESWPHFQRTFDHYLNYSIQLLHMNVPLIAYIDSKSEEFVRHHRRHKELFTKLIVTSLEELEYYEDHDTIKSIMESEEFQTDHAFLHHPEAFSPEYNILLNSKSSMLYRASLDNPFNSTHFFWIDMGYGHGEEIYPEQCNWAPNNLIYNESVGDKITFIQLNPINWLSSIFEVYKKKVPPLLNGGFFGGSLEAVRRYYDVHRDMYKLLLLHHMTDDDQTVAIVCYFHQKELFNLVDGWWYDAFTLFH